MPKMRDPVPKRFNAALCENAHDNLCALNDRYGYGNNDLLTIPLENLDAIVDPDAVEAAFAAFAAEYGQPQ